jgi:hypothetical protein
VKPTTRVQQLALFELDGHGDVELEAPSAGATKACTRCGEVKLLTDYSPAQRYDKRGRPKGPLDGRSSWCRACLAEAARHRQAVKAYGLTLDEIASMEASQGGKCAICGTTTPLPTGSRRALWTRFAVDHCHACGVVRGLLCSACNTGIGHLRDDPAVLRAAIAYLERHNERKTA